MKIEISGDLACVLACVSVPKYTNILLDYLRLDFCNMGRNISSEIKHTRSIRNLDFHYHPTHILRQPNTAPPRNGVAGGTARTRLHISFDFVHPKWFGYLQITHGKSILCTMATLTSKIFSGSSCGSYHIAALVVLFILFFFFLQSLQIVDHFLKFLQKIFLLFFLFVFIT